MLRDREEIQDEIDALGDLKKQLRDFARARDNFDRFHPQLEQKASDYSPPKKSRDAEATCARSGTLSLRLGAAVS